jgi:hypothetical protein
MVAIVELSLLRTISYVFHAALGGAGGATPVGTCHACRMPGPVSDGHLGEGFKTEMQQTRTKTALEFFSSELHTN